MTGDAGRRESAPPGVFITAHVARQARAGAPVPITLRVRNSSEHAVDLYLRGRTLAFDVLVSRPDGSVVWRRLAGQVIPAVLQLRTLAAGEVMELRAEWDQRDAAGTPVGAGDYEVRGQLLLEPPPPLETAPAPLRIG